MGATATDFMLAAGGDDVDAVVERFADWVRRWPAKELARRFDVSVKTAESWHAGRGMPQGRHMTAMVAEWGAAFLDTIYAPVMEDQALDRRLEAVEAVIADLRKDATTHACAAQARPSAPSSAHLGSGEARRRRGLVETARGVALGLLIACTVLPLVEQAWNGVEIAAVDDWARVPRDNERTKVKAKSAARWAPRGKAPA